MAITKNSQIDLNGNEMILDADADTSITADTDDQIDFKTAGSDRVTIDPSGNVGIGTTTPSTGFNTNRNNLVISDASAAGLTLNSTATDGSSIISMTDGTGTLAGEIHYVHDGNSMRFNTDGSERMRVTSNGNLLVGGTYDGFNGRQLIAFTGSGTNNVGLVIQNTATTDDKFIQFVGSSGSEVGDIIQNSATSVDYSTSSDYRKKENISLMENGLERVMKIQPSKFTWKETGKETEGFIAHQLQESGWSEGVSGYKDSESMQTVDYGKITPLLVKAIQEQQVIIDDLKARITSLEGS